MFHSKTAVPIFPASSSRLAAAAATVGLVLALCACAPGSSAQPTPSATTTVSDQPSETPTAEPSDDIALPGTCEEIYSQEMLTQMAEADQPLNDPGVTMFSTEVVEALEIIEVAPTIRCSWGVPSGYGLATNVTIVDAAQAATLVAAFEAQGMDCIEGGLDTRCQITREFADTNDLAGEIHVLRGNAWISTHWINLAPEGYTDDIVESLWG